MTYRAPRSHKIRPQGSGIKRPKHSEEAKQLAYELKVEDPSRTFVDIARMLYRRFGQDVSSGACKKWYEERAALAAQE